MQPTPLSPSAALPRQNQQHEREPNRRTRGPRNARYRTAETALEGHFGGDTRLQHDRRNPLKIKRFREKMADFAHHESDWRDSYADRGRVEPNCAPPGVECGWVEST